MTANDDLIRELAKVISDPGSVLPRHYYRPGERETQEQWAARAVLASLPRLGATVDTGPSPAEEAVKRVEALIGYGTHSTLYAAREIRAALASPAPAVQREDPGWSYNEASGVLYGPDPDHPGLRYPFVTNVEAVIGHRFAEAMNRIALASPAPAPQGGGA